MARRGTKQTSSTKKATGTVRSSMRTAKAVAAKIGSLTPAEEREALMWRLDRLEQQMHRLTELIREHAEDNDRLVRIVAEDRELIRKELVRRHQAQLRARDLLRRIPS
ncbi:MAG: hypothetical protein U0172_04165 [Nitrospiraceae bacterium]